MKTVTNCPICGASSFNEVFKAPYFRGDGELFKIQECNSCRLWFTSPRPEDHDLGAYYETGEYISHNNKKEGLMDYLYHGVRDYSLKKKLSLINKVNGNNGRLLDYGAGTGHFLKTAKANGWQVTGVEPSEEARNVAHNTHQLSLVSPEQFEANEGAYDVITLWHVLEHLPNLQEHISKFQKALNRGGALIIAVPNHESWDSQKYGKNWAALDVPLHLYHFKKRNIQQLAEMNNLKLERVKNMPFDSFYVSMLSEKIENEKSNLPRAFFRGLRSNLKGMPENNASSLIYVLRK